MTMFSKLFGNRKEHHPVSLEYLHTDMHAHLIPDIDDGATDMETAVYLVKKMKQLGFKKLIATPHIMTDIYKNTSADIYEGLQKLREVIHNAGVSIVLEASAEYLVDEGLLRLLAEGELLTMGEGFVLIELPYFSAPDYLNTVIFDLQIAGYKPILAHPERYVYWHHQFYKLEELKERDVYFQLNTISLSGYYSHPTKKMAERLIDAGMIDFLGSDLHNRQSMELLEKTLTEPALARLLDSGTLMNHLI